MGQEGNVLGRGLILLGLAELSAGPSSLSAGQEEKVAPLCKGRLSLSYSVLWLSGLLLEFLTLLWRGLV